MGRCIRYRTGRASTKCEDQVWRGENNFGRHRDGDSGRRDQETKGHSKEGFEGGNFSNGVTEASRQKEVWKFIDSSENSYLLGKNNYPDTIPDVLTVLNNYKKE